jgi:hypothetical protein
MKVVSNSSPLISLGKLESLFLLEKLHGRKYRYLITFPCGKAFMLYGTDVDSLK